MLSETRNVASATGVKKKLTEDPGIRKMLEDANQVDIELYSYIRNTYFTKQQERAAENFERTGVRPARDRYQASRLYTNAIYRPAVKIARKLST